LSAKLVWATPNGEELIGHMARVSNPDAQLGDPTDRLIRYLIRHKHWSPFEMVSVCLELETTRDVSRQILRHRSFHFQEFSGRYAAYDELKTVRECRLQDLQNRQNSHEIEDPETSQVVGWWNSVVDEIASKSQALYHGALDKGIAKEVARSILPEGLVPTRMYMVGTLRDWIHYFDVRCGPETQKEHRKLAMGMRSIIMNQFPNVEKALV